MSKPDIRVCFLGDSFTQGQGDDAALGWVGRVVATERGRGYDLTGYNLGVRGQTGVEIAERAVAEAGVRLTERGDRRAVVICLGANDVFLGRPQAESVRAMDGLLRWADDQAFDAFVLSPPPMSEAALEAKRIALDTALAQVCSNHAVAFLDLPAAVADWDAWHTEAQAGDGVHPNTRGYEHVAQAFGVWRAWRSWLANPV